MHIEIRRILFPNDFSEPAKQARDYAMALRDQFGAELHLLHVIPEVIVPLPDSVAVWTLPVEEMDQQMAVATNRLFQELGSDWAGRDRTVAVSKFGVAVEEIIAYVKEHEIDLIVMGTHGATGFSHLLLGSVAEKVVRLADCPVLTVHPKGHQFLDSRAGK